MGDKPIVLRRHAVIRMLERAITLADIKRVVVDGENIEEYAQDRPYPSRLVLGWSQGRAIHVVVADAGTHTLIITVYEPDPNEWEPGFKARRRGQ